MKKYIVILFLILPAILYSQIGYFGHGSNINSSLPSGSWIGVTQAYGWTFTPTSIYTTSANMGIGTSTPAYKNHISLRGTVKQVTTGLCLDNTTNAEDMEGTGVGILFQGMAYEETTPTSLGSITCYTPNNMTSTESTKDGTLHFYCAVNNVMTSVMSLTSYATFSSHARVGATYGNTSQRDVTVVAQASTFAASRNHTSVTGVAGGDTVDTITGANAIGLYTLLFNDAYVFITDDDSHNANTTDLTADFQSADDATLTLYWDGTSWYEISRSAN